VRDRLNAIAACGIRRLIVVPRSLDADPETVLAHRERFARDVLPEVIA
jgi:hypothetical protein